MKHEVKNWWISVHSITDFYSMKISMDKVNRDTTDLKKLIATSRTNEEASLSMQVSSGAKSSIKV